MRFDHHNDKPTAQVPEALTGESAIAYGEFQDMLSRLPPHKQLADYFNHQLLTIVFSATVNNQKADAQVAKEIRDVRDLMMWIVEVSTPEEALVRLRRQHDGGHTNN